jgi:surfactin synthase thioesterase subunit
MAESAWTVCRLRRPAAALRLYCFPHSGGSPGEFVRWADRLPGIEVLGIQPPGRGARLAEPAIRDVRTLAGALADAVDFREPFAFFGHSLGAYVAYETARELRARGRALPCPLFLSACPAPSVPRRIPPLSGLPDADLVARIERYFGRLAPELRADPDMLALVLPAYRADFAAAETYEAGAGEPLDVPITAFGGTEDGVSAADLRAWSAYTSGPFELHRFPGGHFYLRDQAEALLATLAATVAGTR